MQTCAVAEDSYLTLPNPSHAPNIRTLRRRRRIGVPWAASFTYPLWCISPITLAAPLNVASPRELRLVYNPLGNLQMSVATS